MQLQFQKVKVSRAQSRDMVSTEDLWLTVLNSIVIRVPTVLVLIRAVYSKEKECLVIWDMLRVTVQNLEIVRVDAENNLLLVKGAVPGPKKCFSNNKRDSKVR